MSDTDLAFRATLDGSGVATGAQQITGHLNQLGIQTNAASANLGGLGTVLGTMANPATAVALGITAIGGALVGSAQAAAAWETSMTGVAKTTGLAGPELADLSQDLLTMSTNVPLAASELASIAAAGGSLGIAQDQLAGFTEVAAQMGVGFEMAADQAATAGAKILNAFGKEMNTENLRSLGAVVNTMGDNFAATEPQVLDFLNRASFLNTTMGQSIPQVAALGTALISAGLESEVAATGIKSMLNMLTSETSKTGGIDNWAKLMGTSVDELKEKVAGDLNGTLIETADKIAAIEDPVERFQAAVAAAGSEGAPALLKLAGQQENYQKALGMTNAEWEKASSLQKTFDAQASSANSQWTMFTNTISMAGTELGTSLLPAISDTIGFMTDLAKIGIKVGETINDSVVEPLAELWAMGDSGQPSGIGMAWDAMKDWAGIGTEHAEQMAKEITESEKLQKAGAEGLQAGIDAGVLKDPAKNAAQEFSKEFVDAFKQAQADREIAKILASSGKVTAQDVDDSLRTFDYLGEQFALKIQSHTGAAIGDWYSYSLKAGDVVLAQSQASGNMDPMEAFEMATGLPAPAEGTEAYYRLLGDKVAAEKAKLQEQLKNPFDYSGISSDLRSRMENEGDVIGEIGSDKAKDAYAALLDNFRDPAADKLGEVLDEIATLSAERPLAASEYQLFGEEYKAKLYAGISDMGPYLKGLMGGLGDDAQNAFSDHFFSDTEKESLLGMKPYLEYLLEKEPEYFKEAGGDSWLKFINAIKAGASSSELETMFGEMGQKAGKSFTDSLTGAVHQIQGKPLSEILAGDLSEIGNMSNWIKNTFNPALKTSFDEMYDVYKLGYDQNIQLGIDWVNDKEELYLEHSEWFEDWQADVIQKHIDGNLTEMGVIEAWHKFEESAANKVEKTQSDTVTSAGMFYGQLVDQAAKWTDFVNSEGGFVGPTALYDDFRAATDPSKALSAEINATYNVGTIGSITSIEQAVTIDTSSGPLPVSIMEISDTIAAQMGIGTTQADVATSGQNAGTETTGLSSTIGTASLAVGISSLSIATAKRDMTNLVNWIEDLTPEIYATVKVNVDAGAVRDTVERVLREVLNTVRA